MMRVRSVEAFVGHMITNDSAPSAVSLDIRRNILDDAAQVVLKVRLTRSYLQTLSTDALFTLADQYGLFLGSDLTRHLLIGELLDIDEERSNSEADVNTASVKSRESVLSYNLTEIRIVAMNPLWFFVFWDFHKRLFIELTETRDFLFFSLRVHSLDPHKPSTSLDFFDIEVPNEDRKRYVHVSFDEQLHRVDLVAHFANSREQILAHSQNVNMQRESIPQRLCISQNTVNRITSLSGLAALKKSHFQHYRQAFR